MLGAVQGLLFGEPSPHFPDGETEALSGQGHLPRSHSKEGADANPEMPDSCHPSQCSQGRKSFSIILGARGDPTLPYKRWVLVLS